MTSARAIAGGGLPAATQRLPASAAKTQAPARGAAAARAVAAKTAPLLVFDPAAPVAGAGGLAQTPEIDPVSEITNQIAAGRAYAFSLEALQAADDEKPLFDLKT